jgi:hypothetical protein
MNQLPQRVHHLAVLAILASGVLLSVSGCDRRAPAPTTGADSSSTAPSPQSPTPGASEAMPAEPPASR